MATNTRISLEKNSVYRNDVNNILKYTLLLDFDEQVKTEQASDLVLETVNKAKKCCKSLIAGNENRAVYNFFGYPISQNGVVVTKKNMQRLVNIDMDENGGDKINRMLVQNAVMSAYHAILTEYLSEISVNAYTLENSIEWEIPYNFIRKHGVVYSQKKGEEISIQACQKLITKKARSGKERSSATTRFTNALKVKEACLNKDILAQLSFLFVSNETEGQSKKLVRMQFAQLSSAIVKAELKNFTLLSSKCIRGQYEKRKCFENLANYFSHPVNDTKNIVEQVYFRYISERVLNFQVIRQLLYNIENIHQNTMNRFSETDILEVLAEFLKLPNALSREYFVQFAFDNIDEKINSRKDYWREHNTSARYILGLINGDKLVEKTSRFEFARWIEQVKLFVQFFTEYVIPLTDAYFTNALLEGIEKANPSAKYHEVLYIGLETLGEYIRENYVDFMFPLGKKECLFKKEVDVQLDKYFRDELADEKKKYSYFSCLFEKGMNVELNVKPITLDWFKTKSNKEVLDLYIDYLGFAPKL